MKHIKTYIIGMFLTGALLTSCFDETLVGSTFGPNNIEQETPEARDVLLKVSLPRNFGATSGNNLDRETRIDTLDVLVFEPFAGFPGQKVLLASITGTVVTDEMGNVVDNTFEVGIPLGENLDIHVFANAHSDLLRCGAFGNRGREKEAMLAQIITADKYGLQESDRLLPMHGFITDVTVDKESKNEMHVNLLRSVSKLSVMTKGTITANNELEGGELDEFKLYEMYVFYPTDSARVATADTTRFYTSGADAGNVQTATLPTGLTGGNALDSLSMKSSSMVRQLESLYMYENIAWTNDGLDRATSRLVLGGVYTDPDGKMDTNPDGTPRITYYRVNFQTKDEVPYPILRNHHYVFNINSVAASGYDDPREAAENKAINMSVTIFDWMNELNEIYYDGEHYFSLSSKSLTLPRNKNSVRTVTVDSNVASDEWKMYFKDMNNGVTTPQTWFKDTHNNDSISGTTEVVLSNSRYRVTKESTKIIVEVLKDYSDLPQGESRSDVLVIAAKNLRVNIKLDQKNKSTDDWGNGGDEEVEVGTKD